MDAQQRLNDQVARSWRASCWLQTWGRLSSLPSRYGRLESLPHEIKTGCRPDTRTWTPSSGSTTRLQGHGGLPVGCERGAGFPACRAATAGWKACPTKSKQAADLIREHGRPAAAQRPGCKVMAGFLLVANVGQAFQPAEPLRQAGKPAPRNQNR